jgi:hypothetical protein
MNGSEWIPIIGGVLSACIGALAWVTRRQSGQLERAARGNQQILEKEQAHNAALTDKLLQVVDRNTEAFGKSAAVTKQAAETAERAAQMAGVAADTAKGTAETMKIVGGAICDAVNNCRKQQTRGVRRPSR